MTKKMFCTNNHDFTSIYVPYPIAQDLLHAISEALAGDDVSGGPGYLALEQLHELLNEYVNEWGP